MGRYKIPLYIKTDSHEFILYKPEGMLLQNMRVETGKFPSELFLRAQDKLQGIKELQQSFNEDLRRHIKANDTNRMKDTLVGVVAETLTEPRSGSLEGVAETVDILAGEFATQPGVLKALVNVYFKDYTTAIHSVNVMALTLGYCLFNDQGLDMSKTLGLAALLHDVGKTKIDMRILNANRKLTDDEFAQIKRHPTIGYDILRECDFSDEEIFKGALEHHEKLDGSGYPKGIRDVSLAGQIIGIIDCYEAITNDDRPYRNAMDPLDALALMKREVETEQFNWRLFEGFARSLVK
ncbi:MAG: HD domain-containing protein [Candidatus Coatesbacteria bacterium]|nr:HD domain-containing protein [Candidatus Coatesbacteria bacterium]